MHSIKTEETLANSKAFVFALENFLELVKNGHADTELAFINSCKVTYAISEKNEILGCTVWGIIKQKSSAWIYFSATDKKHRKKGIHSEIIKEVEKQAKILKCKAVYAGIHVSNAPMNLAMKKNGYSQSWYRVKKEIK